MAPGQKAPFALYGLLDDYESAQEATPDSSSQATAGGDDAYEQLFEELVFSTNDPRIGVDDRWEKGCGDPGMSFC